MYIYACLYMYTCVVAKMSAVGGVDNTAKRQFENLSQTVIPLILSWHMPYIIWG